MLKFRKANELDCKQYFEWANDESVRLNSFNQEFIKWADHESWFNKKIIDSNCLMLVFYDEFLNNYIGQVRIELGQENVIGVSIDKMHRNKGLSSVILIQAIDYFFKNKMKKEITAYIKKDNFAYIKAFQNAGFQIKDSLMKDGVVESLILLKVYKEN